LSFEERDKIRKERDRKGEIGGTKRNVSEMTTKEMTNKLTTAIISSIQKVTGASGDDDAGATPTSNHQAGNSFGGKEGAKRARTE
jgi:hypothetical protein